MADPITFVLGDQAAESVGTVPFEVKVTISEVDRNNDGDTDLKIDLEVVNGTLADLRGMFLNVGNDALLTSSLGVFGTDVTAYSVDTDGDGIPEVQQVGTGNVSVGTVGNLQFEIGAALGTNGIGANDIQNTTVYIDANGNITLNDVIGQLLGIRGTSAWVDADSDTVVDEGERSGSGFLVGIIQQDEEEVFEGLSHGYWKNHVSDWDGIATNQSFEAFFNVEAAWVKVGKTGPAGDYTFAEVLSLQGGGVNALAREAVAAILNANDEDINYAYTVDEIKTMVKTAIDSGDPAAIEALKNLLEANNTIGNIA